MKKIYAEELLIKYTEGRCTPEEQLLVEAGFVADLKKGCLEISAEETEAAHMRIKSRVDDYVQANPRSIRKRLWPFIVVVAAAMALIVTGIYFFRSPDTELKDKVAIYVNDIPAGKVGATLTLANGKKIRLTDAATGELARESGVSISKSVDGKLIYEIKDENADSDKINILTTNNGETYQVRLPDGSSVWLNAASSLKYPVSFVKHNNRSVELSGEGYFEIAKNKSHPFIVESNGQRVEVLGTHFNVSAYENEPAIKTTLLEGRVRVNKNTILIPGEQAASINGHLIVSKADIEEAIAWKTGDFQFNEEKLSSIVKKLNRWYDVEITLNNRISEKEFTGKIARSRNISQVLRMIEKINNIKFKIEGRRVTAIEK